MNFRRAFYFLLPLAFTFLSFLLWSRKIYFNLIQFGDQGDWMPFVLVIVLLSSFVLLRSDIRLGNNIRENKVFKGSLWLKRTMILFFFIYIPSLSGQWGCNDWGCEIFFIAPIGYFVISLLITHVYTKYKPEPNFIPLNIYVKIGLTTFFVLILASVLLIHFDKASCGTSFNTASIYGLENFVCLANQASKYDSISYCDEANDVGKCLEAIRSTNPEFCELSSKTRVQDSCWYGAAEDNNEIEYCFKITDGNTRAFCSSRISGNPDYCEGVYPYSEKQRCMII